jgi:glycosyltransferase involved in cell wall biosynthesis
MKPIYVLSETYPSNQKKYQMAFIHPRVKAYINAGFSVKVISFLASKSYEYDGVNVLSVKDASSELEGCDGIVLMSHSPNLRNHIPFIKKWDGIISNLFLFFHGHESLPITKYYPHPFCFMYKERIKYLIHYVYDCFKIRGLKHFIEERLVKGNTELIYVSNWFQHEAFKIMGLTEYNKNHVHVINNGLNPYLLEGHYNPKECLADFITIRPIDISKYAIDLVVQFAEKHPECKFHVYGKGTYFNHHKCPDNLTQIDKFLSPWEIPDILNRYKYALSPTYQDTQGVMMCEMASFGIPTIVSDIDVCHEMLDDYPNVHFLSNDNFDCDIADIPSPLNKVIDRFAFEKTIGKEIELLKECVNN